MPGSNNVSYGNLLYDSIIQPTTRGQITPGTLAWSSATVSANTSVELTTVIPGVLPGDAIDLYLQSAAMTTGLSITNVRVSTADTLSVTWANATGGAVTVPTTSWIAQVNRPQGALSALPPNFV